MHYYRIPARKATEPREQCDKYIRAETPEQAVRTFNDTYVVACPSNGCNPVAMSIDTERAVIEFGCSLLEENCNGELICGGEVPGSNHIGFLGFCVLQREPRISGCTVKNDILKADKENTCPMSMIRVDGKELSFFKIRRTDGRFTLEYGNKKWGIVDFYAGALIMKPVQGGNERILYSKEEGRVINKYKIRV